MRYSWVLFDADHTLFDFDRSAAAALARTIELHGGSPREDHVGIYMEINPRHWKAFERGETTQARLRVERFAEFLAAIDLAAVADRFGADYEVHLGQGTHLLEGAEEILAVLASRLPLGLITNGLANVQRPRLAGSSIQGYFREIVISGEVGAAKPAPEIFDIARERMGNPDPATVLIVGDSLSSDIQGGSDYGLGTCWFNPAGRSCDRDVRIDHEIRQLDELREICLGAGPDA